MNREEIIRMAREAEIIDFRDASDDQHVAQMIEFLQRFADLVVAAERESCAKVCEEISDDYMRSESRLYPEMKTDAQAGASDCEAAIRARNTNKEKQ